MEAAHGKRLTRKRKCIVLQDDEKEKEEEKIIVKNLTACLKKCREERTEEERALLRQHPDHVTHIQKRLEKYRCRKARQEEYEEPESVIADKAAALAEAVRGARHLVVYTGAGVSTAASIPDYRGPDGIWTRLSQGRGVGQHDLTAADPTSTHMALYSLWQRGVLRHVVSQNCDGLHLRSGLPRRHLSELHGNMYLEVCASCPRQYVRTFDVTPKTSRQNHKTGRRCYECATPLIDTVVHFGERGSLRWPLNWRGASRQARKSDVILCLGSSLKVLRKYSGLWCMHRPPHKRPRLFIVNLQWTPKDDCAALKINGRCDDVMRRVMDHLGISVPEYRRSRDPLFRLATPLHRSEAAPRTCLTRPDSPTDQSEASAPPQAPPPESGSQSDSWARTQGQAWGGGSQSDGREMPRAADAGGNEPSDAIAAKHEEAECSRDSVETGRKTGSPSRMDPDVAESAADRQIQLKTASQRLAGPCRRSKPLPRITAEPARRAADSGEPRSATSAKPEPGSDLQLCPVTQTGSERGSDSEHLPLLCQGYTDTLPGNAPDVGVDAKYRDRTLLGLLRYGAKSEEENPPRLQSHGGVLTVKEEVCSKVVGKQTSAHEPKCRSRQLHAKEKVVLGMLRHGEPGEKVGRCQEDRRRDVSGVSSSWQTAPDESAASPQSPPLRLCPEQRPSVDPVLSARWAVGDRSKGNEETDGAQEGARRYAVCESAPVQRSGDVKTGCERAEEGARSPYQDWSEDERRRSVAGKLEQRCCGGAGTGSSGTTTLDGCGPGRDLTEDGACSPPRAALSPVPSSSRSGDTAAARSYRLVDIREDSRLPRLEQDSEDGNEGSEPEREGDVEMTERDREADADLTAHDGGMDGDTTGDEGEGDSGFVEGAVRSTAHPARTAAAVRMTDVSETSDGSDTEFSDEATRPAASASQTESDSRSSILDTETETREVRGVWGQGEGDATPRPLQGNGLYAGVDAGEVRAGQDGCCRLSAKGRDFDEGCTSTSNGDGRSDGHGVDVVTGLASEDPARSLILCQSEHGHRSHIASSPSKSVEAALTERVSAVSVKDIVSTRSTPGQGPSNPAPPVTCLPADGGAPARHASCDDPKSSPSMSESAEFCAVSGDPVTTRVRAENGASPELENGASRGLETGAGCVLDPAATCGVPGDSGCACHVTELRDMMVQTDPIDWREEEFTVIEAYEESQHSSPPHDSAASGCSDTPSCDDGLCSDGSHIRLLEDGRASFCLSDDCLDRLSTSDVIFIDVTSVAHSLVDHDYTRPTPDDHCVSSPAHSTGPGSVLRDAETQADYATQESDSVSLAGSSQPGDGASQNGERSSDAADASRARDDWGGDDGDDSMHSDDGDVSQTESLRCGGWSQTADSDADVSRECPTSEAWLTGLTVADTDAVFDSAETEAGVKTSGGARSGSAERRRWAGSRRGVSVDAAADQARNGQDPSAGDFTAETDDAGDASACQQRRLGRSCRRNVVSYRESSTDSPSDSNDSDYDSRDPPRSGSASASDSSAHSDSESDAGDYVAFQAVFRVSRRMLKPVLAGRGDEEGTKAPVGAGWYGRGCKARRRQKRVRSK